MAAPQKTEEQKRIEKLETLVGKLIKTNTQLMQQSEVHTRALRRLSIKADGLESRIKQLSRPTTK